MQGRDAEGRGSSIRPQNPRLSLYQRRPALRIKTRQNVRSTIKRKKANRRGSDSKWKTGKDLVEDEIGAGSRKTGKTD